MTVKSVDIGRGAGWIGEGFRLFGKDPGIWLAIVVLLVVLTVVAAFLPVIGPIAMQIISPILLGGLMLGCRAQERGEALTIGHLFAGFGDRAGQLAVVGLCYLAGQVLIVIVAVVLLLMSLGGVGALGQLQGSDPAAALALMGSVAIPMLVALALYVPLLMLLWFAPALVVFDNQDALPAMRASFDACLRNILPFLLYGVVGLILAIVASIPLMLGWLVLLPVLIASVYAAYNDICGGSAPA